ncbi:MAG: GNAT family N-acetyltransferase [Anaerolineae bacterium]|nr:GNAT family N-acetyltransferase [Anaerolineae bacterium]
MTDIRLAKPDERETIAALVDAAYSKWIPVIGRKPMPMLADYEKLIADGVVYVFELDGQIIGVLVIWPVEDAMLIENICVMLDQQRGGIGRQLMDFAEQKAREAGLDLMRLYTNEKFEVNIAYYRKLGYVETRRETTADGRRAVWMHKHIR